jgi:hypothetical protein
VFPYFVLMLGKTKDSYLSKKITNFCIRLTLGVREKIADEKKSRSSDRPETFFFLKAHISHQSQFP